MSKDCPWAFMAIAKLSCTGNCSRLNSNGVSVGIRGICGMKTTSPLALPVRMVASKTLSIILLIVSHVPLRSLGEFRFLKSVTGAPTSRWESCWCQAIQKFSGKVHNFIGV
ncbi:Hypothetical predicted protein [Octopus vulgaris]|uniref:Uncharacterized protein n=1 Tax=Octopus vulgaris TaxID=6645 RepID=A0AA36BHP4_OCTVU|nr:Hypothetical predicted protein [Octopus vulgaris]